MSNYFDDDDAFWEPQANDATTQIPRVGRHPVERTRTHHVVTRDTHYQELHDADDIMWFETERQSGSTRRPQRTGLFAMVDPRLLSIGAMALVAILIIPLMSALGGNDGSGADALRSVAEASTTLPVTTVADTTSTVPVVVITAGANLDSAGAEQGSASVGANSSGPEPSVSAGSDTASSASESSDGSGPTSSNGSGSGSGSGSQTAAAGWSPPVCGNPYDVVAGDYWNRLAESTDVSLDFLLEYNNATADTPLYPGTRVCLPLGTTGPGAATTVPAATEAPVTNAPDTTAPPAATEPESTQAPATTTPAPQSTEAPATTATTATTAAPDTTAPVNTEPATTPAPAPTPSGGDIEQIIRDVWPDDLEDQAVRIAWRESNFVSTAQNYCCSGLFQIYFNSHSSWLAGLGITSAEQLYDARTNAQAAYALYQRSGGWGPWAMTRD